MKKMIVVSLVACGVVACQGAMAQWGGEQKYINEYSRSDGSAYSGSCYSTPAPQQWAGYATQGTWTPGDGSLTHNVVVTGPNGSSHFNQSFVQQGNQVGENSTYTGPGGQTFQGAALWTGNGNSVTRQGVTVSGSGQSGIGSSETWTHNGNSVSAQGYVATPDGNAIWNNGAWTQNGNTLTHNATFTGPNGRSSSVSANYSLQGNQLVKTATFTGPNGRTAQQGEIWSQNGNTITRNGGVSFGGGNYAIGNQNSWTRNGNTVSGTGQYWDSNGNTAYRTGSWAQNGNTVTHQGQGFGAGPQMRNVQQPSFQNPQQFAGARQLPQGRGDFWGRMRR